MILEIKRSDVVFFKVRESDINLIGNVRTYLWRKKISFLQHRLVKILFYYLKFFNETTSLILPKYTLRNFRLKHTILVQK